MLMYGYYYYDTNYLIFMIISLIVSGYAHFKVRHTFEKYSKIPCKFGITGAEAAEKILHFSGVKGITLYKKSGYFTDYFDSSQNEICLSEKVYDKTSIAAVSVASHESGHAIQNEVGYFPLKLRHSLVHISNFGSKASIPLIILGMLVPSWSFAINLGIIFFSLAVLFQLVTLPVEFNASKRALEVIRSTAILDESEIEGAKKVLSAAAFTYVAAAFTSILSLIRLLLIAKGRNKR